MVRFKFINIDTANQDEWTGAIKKSTKVEKKGNKAQEI